MQEIIQDTLADSLPMLPILFIAYLLLEIYEHHGNSEKEYGYLRKYGPIFGAFLGVFPQCGFSVVAATMFLNGRITIGTLLSIFIATSDEAIPILLSNPDVYESIFALLLVKIIVGITVGYLVDNLFRSYKIYHGSYKLKEQATCDVHENVVMTAIKHTLKIFAFVLIVNFILTLILSQIGEDTLSTILLSHTPFQPIISGIFGFIPNCAASVVLTQLYIAGVLSFGALSAGLITNAGLGLLILIRYRIEKRYLLFIIIVLFMSATITGMLLSML